MVAGEISAIDIWTVLDLLFSGRHRKPLFIRFNAAECHRRYHDAPAWEPFGRIGDEISDRPEFVIKQHVVHATNVTVHRPDRISYQFAGCSLHKLTPFSFDNLQISLQPTRPLLIRLANLSIVDVIRFPLRKNYTKDVPIELSSRFRGFFC